MAAERIPYISPEEYLAIERAANRKSEYISGQMYAMSGASCVHNLIAVNITRELSGQLRGKPYETYSADMRVQVRETGLYTYPDVTVVCGEPRFTDASVDTLLNPLVIVEVLSASTKDYDRGEKWAHYRQLDSLLAYVVVHQDKPAIEYHHRAEGGSWQTEDIRGPEASLLIEALDCTLRMQEVYERVAFDPPASDRDV
jgi:Uma2 family endonuclease